MTFATGIGSMPGETQRDFGEAVRIVFGELGQEAGGGSGLPYLPEVPGRGVVAAMIGRTLGLITELGVDLQPAGWRITSGDRSSGADHRRARSLISQDLDTLEEHASAYAGDLKVQVAGPWTLASVVERPRGDRVLADHGLRRELAGALAEAVTVHVADLRRRVPDATRLIVQVDEPAMGAVLAARVPTASGFGRHRAIGPPEASELLEVVLDAVRGAGAEPWVHSCAADAPLALMRSAGAHGLLVDPAALGAEAHDVLAEALEAGETVVLGVLPADGQHPSDETASIEQVLRWLDRFGLDPGVVGERVGVSPSCGLAAGGAAAQPILALAVAVARNLT